MRRRITRSRNEKVFAGVCGGVAEYFNLDPTIVRLGFVIAALFGGGIGFIAYIVLLIVVPSGEKYAPPEAFKSNNVEEEFDEEKDFSEVLGDKIGKKAVDPERNKAFIGICLILLGGMFFAKEVLKWDNFESIVPVILMVIGGFIVFGSRRNR